LSLGSPIGSTWSHGNEGISDGKRGGWEKEGAWRRGDLEYRPIIDGRSASNKVK